MYRSHPRVAPPECKNAVDQIASAVRRPPDLLDMLCGLGSRFQLGFGHFRIAKYAAMMLLKLCAMPLASEPII